VEAYWQFGSVINYHPRIAIGLSRSGLPPSEKFYMGGVRSFMGLRTYQLGGDKLFHMSHELRFKLPWRFYLTGRYDLGEVFTSAEDIKADRLRHGGGAILAFDSPIGPFEFAYGWSEDDMERFYINIGLRF
jgi:outer membrane translocation and assembly module TamA